jgi:hypothetical protein
MNKEERREIRKKARLFSRLYDMFGFGGYGRIPAKTAYPQDEPKTFETVLVENGYVMECRLPVGAMGDALTRMMEESECVQGVKWPSIKEIEGLKPGMYPLSYFLEALNVLAITDEHVMVRCAHDFPIEVAGKESGIKFMIAPRFESVD